MSSSTPSTMRFWRPGTLAPGSSIEREDESHVDLLTGVAHAATASSRGGGGLTMKQQRMVLPIAGHRSQLLYALEKHQVLIMTGETGSGKSSQLPQYLDEAGWTQGGLMIGVTQPRRVAASSIAERVAQEMGVRIGEEVGYAFRFEDATSDATRIKFLTDGLLLRETLSDPLLSQYSVLMLDEAHERSVSTDVLMGLLKKILRKRPELRLIVSSATLDAETFLDYFQSTMPGGDEASPSACILTVEGRQFPVEIFYAAQPVQDYLRATVDTILHIAQSQPPGDILAFLTGREEIDRVVRMIDEEAGGAGKNSLPLQVLPLYAGLSSDRQAAVFAPAGYGQRKVVISTNVAEASVTIDGVGYVIDCGFSKHRFYSPSTGTSHLALQQISQAAAQQRSGRSGRTKKGVAYRLYTEAAFHALPSRTQPELQRTNILPVILQLKALGVDRVVEFEFMDPPPLISVARALEQLHALDAIDSQARLTSIGRALADFPLEPPLARMLLASTGMTAEVEETKLEDKSGKTSETKVTLQANRLVRCSEEMLTICAMLSVDNVFLQASHHHARSRADQSKSHFAVHEGDHLTLLNVFNAFLSQRKKNPASWAHANGLNFKTLVRAVDVRKQLRKHLLARIADHPEAELVSCQGDSEAIRKALLSGMFMNVAQLQVDGTYRPIRAAQGSKPSRDATPPEPLHIHPTSVLHSTTSSAIKPMWLTYHELLTTNKQYMREISVIQPEWLTEVAPRVYELTTGFEEENRRHAQIAARAERETEGKALEAADTDGVVGEPDRKHRRLF